MQFLKYTTYDIQNLIINKLSKFADIEIASLEFGIPVSELNLFFNENHFFSPQMYENASTVLNISIEELTEIKKINPNEIIKDIKYRESIKPNVNKDSFMNEGVEKGIFIFKEIINIYKLNGGE